METLYQIGNTISFLAFVIAILFVFLVEPIVYTLQFYFWLVKKNSPRSKPTLRLSRAWITAAIIISLPFAVLSFSGLVSKYKQQRIEQTEKTASELADRFFAQLEADPDAALKPGPLEQTDAWDQKLRLTVQRSVFGHGVEIYSNGPDGEPGTRDDLMVSRFHPAAPEEFGGSLALKGKVAIENWIAGKKDLLVPDKDGDEVKIEQEFNGAKISIKFGSGNQKE